MKETPTTDLKKEERRSTSEPAVESSGTKTFQKGGGEKSRDLEPVQVRELQIRADSGKDQPRYSDRIIYLEENFLSVSIHRAILTSSDRAFEGELEVEIHRDLNKRESIFPQRRKHGQFAIYPASIGWIHLDIYYLFVRATQHDNINAEFMQRAI